MGKLLSLKQFFKDKGVGVDESIREGIESEGVEWVDLEELEKRDRECKRRRGGKEYGGQGSVSSMVKLGEKVSQYT